MSLEKIASKFENLTVQLSEQHYNQWAGLPYDRDMMRKLSKQVTGVSLEFLENFTKPRSMYLYSIANISHSEKLETELNLHDRRMEKISTEKYRIAGHKVNWGSWRQFTSATNDYVKRKEVFDEFVAKAPEIAPLVEKRMSISKDVYRRYGLTPLDSYLELEGIGYDELRDLLIRLGDGAKDAFLTAAEHFVSEVLGKEKMEYYDDFYTWRGRV
ncbi:MAG: hypothetical protein JSV85_04185, partial [Candidatus Bathyarchaeota archaeon]